MQGPAFANMTDRRFPVETVLTAPIAISCASLSANTRRRRVGLLCTVFALMAANVSAVAEDLANVDTITILPVAFPSGQSSDERAETLESLYGELDDFIYKALLRKLSLKGYVLDKPRKWARPSDWTADALSGISAADLARLMPEHATFGAFLLMETIDASGNFIASSANTVVTAKIVDRASESVVWERRAEAEYSESFLKSLLFGPPTWFTPDKHAAVEDAFSKLFEDLPEKN